MQNKIDLSLNKRLWMVVILIGIYVAFQLSADVAASKLVQLGPWSMPAGTFIFALTFTWRDLMHRKLGKRMTYYTIIAAALANVVMVLYFMFTFILPPASFWPLQDAYTSILGVVPRITIASIVAELVSESIDTEVYAWMKNKKPWARVLVSNAFSLPADSAVFAVLAFAGTMPMGAIWGLMAGQIVFKAAVTIISVPLIYLWNKNKSDYADYDYLKAHGSGDITHEMK